MLSSTNYIQQNPELHRWDYARSVVTKCGQLMDKANYSYYL